MSIEHTIGTPQWFYKGFRKHFPGMVPSHYIDVGMIVMDRKCRLDVLAFDDALHDKFGEYEAEGKSMRDMVVEKFSTEAAEFLEQCMGINRGKQDE